eukprot:288805-Pelagomonas_calceolata.AAC.5
MLSGGLPLHPPVQLIVYANHDQFPSHHQSKMSTAALLTLSTSTRKCPQAQGIVNQVQQLQSACAD